MSCDLAVWEGERPADDAAADSEFERLYAHYIAGSQLQPPIPRIAPYVRTLLASRPFMVLRRRAGAPLAANNHSAPRALLRYTAPAMFARSASLPQNCGSTQFCRQASQSVTGVFRQ